jgi:hypothetical protein
MLLATPDHMSTSALDHVPFSFISNVESVHLQAPNISNVDVSQLVVVETQDVSWRPHNHLFICWWYFIVNDDLLVDLVKPQML